MKNLHTVSALIELSAGLVLLVSPSAAAQLLFGSPLETSAAVALGRLAGAALLALGVACWCARGNEQSRPARGMAFAMLVYNIGAAVILGAAGLGSHSVGIVLWAAVILHTILAAWCVTTIKCFRF
jgi:hypothetical protein